MSRETGALARPGAGGKLTSRTARRIMIALTILGVVTLSLGGVFTFVQHASANTYDVCASGCTYTTIQNAINNTSPTLGSPLTSISVGPGTYNEAITINRTLSLVGANVGVDPVTSARSAESIIDATGHTIAVTITAPNVHVEGFTITGAHGNSGHVTSAGITGPSGVGGLQIVNNIITDNYNGIWELGGTNLTIAQNVIRDNSAKQFGDSCFSGAPYCNGIFIGANFTSLNITGNTIDESGLPADFATHFQRAMSINPTAQGTLTVSGNTLYNSSTLGNVTGTFTSNAISGDFGIRLVGGVSDFTIASNTFSGLFSNAIISQNSFNSAGNKNLTIVSNTITQNVARHSI